VYGEDIPNNKVVDKILRTIPKKFDHVVTIIIESHDTNVMYGSRVEESKVVQKIEVKKISTIEEEKTTKAVVVEITKEEDGEISTKEETTISGHLAKEEVKILLVSLIRKG